jgi:hypothetical protein
MGMYTQLHLDLKLKIDTPKEIIDTLTDMVNVDSESEKWNNRLDWCFNSNSYYFNAFSYAKIWKDGSIYKLFVHCDFKNYDNEIAILLNWLKPYIDTQGMIGYTRYEEDEEPTILYN